MARELVVVPRDLHGHALLDIAVAALQDAELDELVLGVEVAHVLGGALIEERREAVDDVALVTGVLDRGQEGLLALGGDILVRLGHGGSP